MLGQSAVMSCIILVWHLCAPLNFVILHVKFFVSVYCTAERCDVDVVRKFQKFSMIFAAVTS